MKSNWWKLVVIVLVAVVVAGCASKKNVTQQPSNTATTKSTETVFAENTAPRVESSVSDKKPVIDDAPQKDPAVKPAVQPKNSVKPGDICPPSKTVKVTPAVEKPTPVKPVAAKPQAPKTTALANAKPNPSAETPKKLPKLLDLGATKCVPCKMMVPVLEELAKEYKGKLVVQFIDVWKDESAAKKYKVQSIPTQIFFDAKGKEFFRHVGFFAKEDILKVFKDHGIKLK